MVPRVLTRDDPEPAVMSVVLDRWGQAWQRSEGAWIGRDAYRSYARLLEDGPLTLIHDGGAL